MCRYCLLIPTFGVCVALHVCAAIQYGKTTFPEGAAALKTMTVSGPVAAPRLMRAENGVKLQLSGTGGAYGVAKRLGSLQREGEYVFAATRISNPTRSFVTVEFQIYNATEKRVLAQSSPVVIRNSESPAVNIKLEYAAARRDVGDLLLLRWIQSSTEHPSRSFCIEELVVEQLRPMVTSETFPGGDPGHMEPAVFSGEAGLPTLDKAMADGDNGDGQGDGSIAVNSKELGGTYGAVWKLGKAEKPGTQLHLETVWFNAGNSYVTVDVQLYNATKNVVLASSGAQISKNKEAPAVAVALDYQLKSEDKGCELEVRWVQTSTEHPSRNFMIDRFSISEPEK